MHNLEKTGGDFAGEKNSVDDGCFKFEGLETLSKKKREIMSQDEVQAKVHVNARGKKNLSPLSDQGNKSSTICRQLGDRNERSDT